MTDHTPSPATDGLRDLLYETLELLRVETVPADIDVLADAVEKSDWLKRIKEGEYVTGNAHAFDFVDQVRAEAKAWKAAHPAPLADPAPEAASIEQCECEMAFKWGATGIIPPGHFMHREGQHSYLAHLPADLPVATGVTTEDEGDSFFCGACGADSPVQCLCALPGEEIDPAPPSETATSDAAGVGLTEDERRQIDERIEANLWGYYLHFDTTGVPEVDRILSAIGLAAKAFHHTEGWNDDLDWAYGPISKGEACADFIQRVAADAANLIRARGLGGAS